MEENMVEKYQEHYKQILVGTLTDTFMKTLSFQANIKLANEIISEQEKTINELKSNTEKSKKEMDDNVIGLKKEIELLKNNRVSSENNKINNLENNIRIQNDNISRLNSEINRLNTELSNANRAKVELENLKNQASSADVFRKELIKERENHELTKSNYEKKLKELSDEIELLKTPPKRKKVNKQSNVLELVNLEPDIENAEISEEFVKDGGTF